MSADGAVYRGLVNAVLDEPTDVGDDGRGVFHYLFGSGDGLGSVDLYLGARFEVLDVVGVAGAVLYEKDEFIGNGVVIVGELVAVRIRSYLEHFADERTAHDEFGVVDFSADDFVAGSGIVSVALTAAGGVEVVESVAEGAVLARSFIDVINAVGNDFAVDGKRIGIPVQ